MKRMLICLLFALIILCPSASPAKTPTVLKHLGNDISNTFANWPVLVILGGGVASAEVYLYDDQIANQFRDDPMFGEKVHRVADVMGALYFVDPAVALTYVIGLISHNETIKLSGETLLETLLLMETSTYALKGVFHRTRPNGNKLSFPSGHASRTFAVAAALEVLHGPAVGIPAFIYAGFISFARIDQGYHYLSDVIFGAAWGAAIGWGTARYHKKLHNEKYVILPTCAGHPGLSITYRF